MLCRVSLLVGVLLALGSPLAHADSYTFTLVPPPFADVTGVSIAAKPAPEVLVGTYNDTELHTHGFLQMQGHTIPLLTLLPLDATVATIVGNYIDKGVAFLYANGQLRVVQAPECLHQAVCDQIRALPALHTAAWGINGPGVVVGTFRRAREEERGFRYDPTAARGSRFTLLTPPVPPEALWPLAINDAGMIVGFVVAGGIAHGFVTDGTTWTTFDAPGAASTQLNGVNNASPPQMSGVTDTGSFVTDGTTTVPVLYPGGQQTVAQGVNDQGEVFGHVVLPDGTIAGFVATPATARQGPRSPEPKRR